MPELAQNFEYVVSEYTAGSPTDDELHWTNLTQQQIAVGLEEAGTPVSTYVVRQLLDDFEFSRRKHSKVLALGSNPDRNAQFERIAELKEEYLESGDPVLSIDTKRKELLGNYARAGELYARKRIEVNDHDFGGKKRGLAIPHGIYDVGRNQGHVTLGTSHDTSEFAVDSLRCWWELEGQTTYRRSDRALLLCDGGGSNRPTDQFKADLQQFADETEWEVRVAHYPPYASKYNPIEHRMFCHVERTLLGMVLKSLDLVAELIVGTHTAAGLEVSVSVLDRVYEVGRKITAAVTEGLQVIYDDYLGKWNYRIVPHTT
jgi:hypothetical protein